MRWRDLKRGEDVESIRMRSACPLLLRQLGVSFVTGKEDWGTGPVFKAFRETQGGTAIAPWGDIAGLFMVYGNTITMFSRRWS